MQGMPGFSKEPPPSPLVHAHLRLLFRLAILLRLVVALIALLASYLPAFDSSADILLDDASHSLLRRWLATSLRWDAFHFLHIAETKSYAFEHEWAFFPGVPFISYVSGCMLTLMWGRSSVYSMLFGQYLASMFLTPATAKTLYALTLEHSGSPDLALLSACLSLLSSSPATLAFAPYAESWFAFLSYKGMLSCARRQWAHASAYFTLACMFRSNGILLVGFIVWGMVVEPFIIQRRTTVRLTLSCIILSTLPTLPFAWLQAAAYREFCMPSSPGMPSWCAGRLPLMYSHVQSYYWNVGFLRYWTLQQLPNFLIAGPVLLLLLCSSLTHILRFLPAMSFPLRPAPRRPFLTLSLLPHAIHALVMTCLLLFASHTQIILRLASSMPFTYWSAARLFSEHPKWARAWVAWSIVWGATSVVLWTAFLPPA